MVNLKSSDTKKVHTYAYCKWKSTFCFKWAPCSSELKKTVNIAVQHVELCKVAQTIFRNKVTGGGIMYESDESIRTKKRKVI